MKYQHLEKIFAILFAQESPNLALKLNLDQFWKGFYFNPKANFALISILTTKIHFQFYLVLSNKSCLLKKRFFCVCVRAIKTQENFYQSELVLVIGQNVFCVDLIHSFKSAWNTLWKPHRVENSRFSCHSDFTWNQFQRI